MKHQDEARLLYLRDHTNCARCHHVTQWCHSSPVSSHYPFLPLVTHILPTLNSQQLAAGCCIYTFPHRVFNCIINTTPFSYTLQTRKTRAAPATDSTTTARRLWWCTRIQAAANLGNVDISSSLGIYLPLGLGSCLPLNSLDLCTFFGCFRSFPFQKC